LNNYAPFYRAYEHTKRPHCGPDSLGDKEIYRTRGRIEIMFRRLKDWRRIAMRYDCAAHTFFSAIALQQPSSLA
jgi:transposase